MSDLIKVQGNSNLARDRKSGALININKDEFTKAKAARLKRKNKEQRFKNLENEVGEIKILLQQLLEEK